MSNRGIYNWKYQFILAAGILVLDSSDIHYWSTSAILDLNSRIVAEWDTFGNTMLIVLANQEKIAFVCDFCKFILIIFS